MKKNGKFIAVIALSMGMILAACSQPTGGGGGTPTNNDNTPEQTIKNLPSYTGSFVANQDEASQLALTAQNKIDDAILAAIGNGTSSGSMARAAVNESGHYEYNGVKLDYTVSISGAHPSYPYSQNVTESGTINGTYGGYDIKGNFDIKYVENATSASASSIKFTYNMVYVISHNGKGMKIVHTGDMTVTVSGATQSISYDLHYAVYDNANQRRYNADYKMTI